MYEKDMNKNQSKKTKNFHIRKINISKLLKKRVNPKAMPCPD